MEGNTSQGGMFSGGLPFGGLDLQGSMRIHHQPQHHPHAVSHQGSIREGFPLTMGTMHSTDHSLSMADYKNLDGRKNSLSEDDEPSYTEEGADGHHESVRGKKGSPWQRVKWTDKMIKLLITAVSYIGEDGASDCGGGMRRKFVLLQKKGKWKSVSKVMSERGFHVSPQQCEDKFNDLNKRYKKLNDMLGRGTSCQVVENPALLDVIDYLSEKEKDDVRKILSSKHLFYEEMCSYHNGNRLHLPHDPALQRSLQLALRSRDDHDNDGIKRHDNDDIDEDDPEVDTDGHDEFEETCVHHGDSRGVHGTLGGSLKRLRQDHVSVAGSSQDGHKGPHSISNPIAPLVDMNQASPESARQAMAQKQRMESRTLQLEEQRLQIQVEILELEKQRFKWQRFSQKRDHELEKFRMENERMKLENERMALELKHKEMGADFS
ncbi:hypothetical protein LINGRAHAP2_LOCUS32660 [Linum grandiflorum]